MCELNKCNGSGIYRIGGDYKDTEGCDVIRQNICECKAGQAFKIARDSKKEI